MNAQSAVPPLLQVIWAVCGILALLGGAAFFVIITWPFIRHSRRRMDEMYALGQASMALGKTSADSLRQLKEELSPVISKLNAAVTDAHGIMGDIRKNEVEKVLKALEAIPGKLDEIAAKAGRGAVESMIDKI